jgi:hypothetical protein
VEDDHPGVPDHVDVWSLPDVTVESSSPVEDLLEPDEAVEDVVVDSVEPFPTAIRTPSPRNATALSPAARMRDRAAAW